MTTTLNPELTEISLERLRLPPQRQVGALPGRRAAGLGRRDGLPARRAGQARAGRGGRARRLRLRLAAGARAGRGLRRLRRGRGSDWEVDPRAVSASSDVVGAITAVLRAIAEAGRPGRHQHARLPPLLRRDRGARLRAGRSAARSTASSTSTRSSAHFADGAVALILCSPHNPTGGVPSREQLARDRRRGGAPRRLGARRRDPRAADPSRRPARALPHRLRGGGASTASPSARPRRRSTSPACTAPRSSPPPRARPR